MAVANYGVNVTISADAARPIAVESLTPIGVCGYQEGLEEGLHFYLNTSTALQALEKLGDGSIKKAVDAIDDQAVETPIILSVFKKDSDGDMTLTNAISAIEDLKNSKSKFGYAPNIIICPEFSGEDAIKGALETIATRLKATAIVDLKAGDVASAIIKMKDFGTRRLIATYPEVKTFDKKAVSIHLAHKVLELQD